MKKLMYNTQYIDAYMQKHEIDKTEFCKRANITLRILDNIYAQKDMPYIYPLAVVDTIGISVDMFVFRIMKKKD